MKKFQISLFVSILVAMADLTIVGYMYKFGSVEATKIFIDSLGILGTLAVVGQYTPQIFETYKIKVSLPFFSFFDRSCFPFRFEIAANHLTI